MLVAAARAAYLIACPIPTMTGSAYIVHVKNNLAPAAPGLAYRIVGAEVKGPDFSRRDRHHRGRQDRVARRCGDDHGRGGDRAAARRKAKQPETGRRGRGTAPGIWLVAGPMSPCQGRGGGARSVATPSGPSARRPRPRASGSPRRATVADGHGPCRRLGEHSTERHTPLDEIIPLVGNAGHCRGKQLKPALPRLRENEIDSFCLPWSRSYSSGAGWKPDAPIRP